MVGGFPCLKNNAKQLVSLVRQKALSQTQTSPKKGWLRIHEKKIELGLTASDQGFLRNILGDSNISNGQSKLFRGDQHKGRINLSQINPDLFKAA